MTTFPKSFLNVPFTLQYKLKERYYETVWINSGQFVTIDNGPFC